MVITIGGAYDQVRIPAPVGVGVNVDGNFFGMTKMAVASVCGLDERGLYRLAITKRWRA